MRMLMSTKEGLEYRRKLLLAYMSTVFNEFQFVSKAEMCGRIYHELIHTTVF